MIRVLGIETSCDETAAAVVALDDGGRPHILSNIVLSQIEEHAAFGGVVPEIAARAHVEALDGIVEAALADAGVGLADVDAIAATAGPGLVGGLIVGLMTAKALAAAAGKPLLGGQPSRRPCADRAPHRRAGFPVSAAAGFRRPYAGRAGARRRPTTSAGATTIDDALGEAFDKTAKLIGLPYPGGPNVEKAAQDGDPQALRFPAAAEGRGAARISPSPA